MPPATISGDPRMMSQYLSLLSFILEHIDSTRFLSVVDRILFLSSGVYLTVLIDDSPKSFFDEDGFLNEASE